MNQEPQIVQTDTIPFVSENDVSEDHVVCCFPAVACNQNQPLPKNHQEELSREQWTRSHETMSNFDYCKGSTMDLIEVCAPWDSPLCKHVEDMGGCAMRMGIHNGFDLSTRKGFLEAAKVFRKVKPRKAHFLPPCFPWSQFQNLNQRTPEQCADLQQKREHSRKLLKNLEKLAEIQHYELGGDISGEQPWKAGAWKEKTWSRMAKMAGGKFRVDGCRFGMKNPKTQKLFQKGWGFFSSSMEVRLRLAKTCNHPAAMHDRIEGSYTASTAVYPPALCKAFVQGLFDRHREFLDVHRSMSRHQHGLYCGETTPKECDAVYANDEPDQGVGNAVRVEQIEDEPEVDDGALTAEEMNRLKTVHKNFGHPSNAVLQRMLTQANAKQKFIRAAGSFECDICKRQAQKKPVLPASPHVPQNKWEVVSVDTFWWKHPVKTDDGKDRYVVGISYLDEATDLHVASIVREEQRMPPSVTSDEFIKKFAKDWLRCLPKPKMVRLDTEGCFRGGKVSEWMEQQMIQVSPIAGEAYWQIGKHSRHLHTLKQQMLKLAEDLPKETSCKEILALCVSAKNEMHAIKGYSPNQWAFGQNSDRIDSTLNCYHHLPSMSTSDPSFHENIKKMSKARELFIQVDSERKLIRAADLKSRKVQEFETGMLVYYYRKGRGFGAKVRGQWHGPARVLFIEKTTQGDRGSPGSIIWISHGTHLLRCAPEQLQPVCRDLSSVDQLVNGPFSPDEFLQGKHGYYDLFGEKDQLNDEATGVDDTAWNHNPDNMDLFQDDPSTNPEGPLRRLRFKQKGNYQSSDLDRVVTHPHVEQPCPANQSSEPREDGRGRCEGLDHGRDGQVQTGSGQPQGQRVPGCVEQPRGLLRVVRGPSLERGTLEGMDALPSDEDGGVGEGDERRPEGYQPVRRGGVGRTHPRM